MNRFCFVTILLCLVGVSSVYGQQAQTIEGVYERVSLTNLTSGQQRDPDRHGLMIIAHGYYSMMTIKPDRPTLKRGQHLTDLSKDNQIAYLQAWLDMNAHCGPYEVRADTLIWHRNLSEDPKEVGTVTRLRYQLRDGNLIIHFGLSSGSRWEWVWRKIR